MITVDDFLKYNTDVLVILGIVSVYLVSFIFMCVGMYLEKGEHYNLGCNLFLVGMGIFCINNLSWLLPWVFSIPLWLGIILSLITMTVIFFIVVLRYVFFSDFFEKLNEED